LGVRFEGKQLCQEGLSGAPNQVPPLLINCSVPNKGLALAHTPTLPLST